MAGTEPFRSTVQKLKMSLMLVVMGAASLVIPSMAGTRPEVCTLTCSASSPATATAGQTVYFSASSTPSDCSGSTQYYWDFGDGGRSSQQNPTHTYDEGGQYQWTMTAQVGASSCLRFGSITVSGGGGTCTVTCNASVPTKAAAGSAVSFSGTAEAPNCSGSPRFFWDFGDGRTSSNQTASHSYPDGGIYNWTMSATASGIPCTRTGSIEITGGGGPCTVTCSATAPASARAGDAVAFTGASTSTNCSGSPRYYWDFGDGRSSTSQSPYHTFSENGQYSWTLTVTVGAIPCTRFGVISISGGSGDCTVECSATAPLQANSGETVAFSGSASAPNCTQTPRFYWNFGDGDTSTQQSPSHSYALGGQYGWTMTASSGPVACTKSGSILVSGGTGTCTVSCTATVPAEVMKNEVASFMASATLTGCSGSARYFWSFGDGRSSTLQSPTHAYEKSGIYHWTMTAAAEGIPCVKQGVITVKEVASCSISCTATVPLAANAGDIIPFGLSASAVNCAGAPSFSWNFGDGGGSTKQNPTHAYILPGIYLWTVRVAVGGVECDRWGWITIGVPQSLVSTIPSGVPVEDTLPEDGWRYFKIAAGQGATQLKVETIGLAGEVDLYVKLGMIPQTYDYDYASKQPGIYEEVTVGRESTPQPLVAGEWYFGVFGYRGTAYTITATVAEAGSCSVSCGAAVPPSGSPDSTIQFEASASAANCPDAVQYYWEFGDGRTSVQQNPVHSYGANGTFAWKVTVYAGWVSCSETGTIAIGSTGGCDVSCDALVSRTSGQAPLAVEFTGTATETGCQGEPEFHWDFGDGTGSALPSASHVYSSEGSFDWTLSASAGGVICTRSGTVTVTAEGNQPELKVVDTSATAGSSVDLPLEFVAGQKDACTTINELVYNPEILSFIDVQVGPAGTAAGKRVGFKEVSPSQLGIAVYGEGTTPIGSGVVATVTFSIAPGAWGRLGLSNYCLVLDCAGAQVDTTCTSGSVTIVGGEIPGDCDGDGAVSIGELQKAISMFLGLQPADCGADCGDGAVSIADLQKVINAFLGLNASC